MKRLIFKASKGFTLLEILLVVAAIAILAGIVILALNPGKQLAETKNAQRSVDVNTILNAIYQQALDNNGTLAASILTCTAACGATATEEICKTGGTCTGLTDLSALATNETYLTGIPTDPTGSSANGTGYHTCKTANNRVTVCAPSAEQGATITVTR